MADRIADNPELLVDEMKRKARRRLVGAVVLALAAAVILPLLLEKEPRPLGDDISVQIPPVDEGKFVNRLTGKTAESKALPKADGKSGSKADERADSKSAPAKSESRSGPIVGAPAPSAGDSGTSPVSTPATGEANAPRKAVADDEQRERPPVEKAETKPPSPGKADSKPAMTAKVEPKSAPAAKADTRPAAATKADPKLAAASEAKIEPNPAAAESKAETTSVAQGLPATPPGPASVPPAKPEGFVVQLAAFADDKGANSLANRLKKVGYAAYVEPVQTSRGTLWRVRVGGYSSRSEADAARVKLKGEGYSGIVAPS